MPRGTLVTLVGLRRATERRALGDLATQMSLVEQAQKALGAPPAPMGSSGEAPFVTLNQRCLASATEWAVWGARLERLERARGDEDRMRGEWVRAAADLRATQRLVERRRHQQRIEAARGSQARADETAVNSWRRRTQEQGAVQ